VSPEDGFDGSLMWDSPPWGACYHQPNKVMELSFAKVTYQGFRTNEGWEVVVKRLGQPLRLLDLPRRKGEWALSILTNYLDDPGRATDLHNDFAALTLRRFTTDWELTDSDIEKVLTEVEILRARLCIALARG
jgi:hypothetical protein